MSVDPPPTPDMSGSRPKREDSRLKKKEEERLKKEAELKKKAEEKQKKELEKKKKEEEKLLEKKKKEEERIRKEQEKEEEKKRKEEERLKKEQEKEEEKRKKEEERLKREQEKEEEKRKKEEERLKREQERENEKKLKEAERQKREEERLRKKAEKEEELKKKEEERIKKEREEEERLKKKKRQSALLLNFVVKENKDKDTSFNPVSTDRTQKPDERFMQFIVKKDQRLAPRVRVEESVRLEKGKRLDEEMNAKPEASIVQDLKKRKPLTCPDTWPLKKPDDIVCLADLTDEGSCWLKAKLFQFVENNRPAYYGSFRQKSKKISGRRPFTMDQETLNYEVDSDEEWEEEEPGESIASSDNEEEEDEKEESDEDDFLVPHGYLSDDEGVNEDDDPDAPKDPAASRDRDMKTLRQRLSLAVYEAAHERSSSKLHPKLFGCLWIDDGLEMGATGPNRPEDPFASDNKENLNVSSDVTQKTIAIMNEKVKQAPPVKRFEVQITEQVLLMFKAHIWPAETIPIKIMNNLPEIESKQKSVKRSKTLPDECTPYLVPLIHGSSISRMKIAFEFRSFWHKKVTGKLPLVLDFKQFTANNNPNNTNDKNFVEHLPFSQALVSNKIFELSSFESKYWIVKKEFIDKYREESIKALPDNEIDPETKLPIWSYVTQVKKKVIKEKDDLNKSGKEDKSGTPSIERKRSDVTGFFQPRGKKQCI